MPDGSKAALWFTQRCVFKRFHQQAEAKRYEIKSYNQTFATADLTSRKKKKQSKSSVQTPLPENQCFSCNSIFDTRSKPSLCSYCKQYVHKKCLNDHKKLCQSRRLVTPLVKDIPITSTSDTAIQQDATHSCPSRTIVSTSSASIYHQTAINTTSVDDQSHSVTGNPSSLVIVPSTSTVPSHIQQCPSGSSTPFQQLNSSSENNPSQQEGNMSNSRISQKQKKAKEKPLNDQELN